MMKSVAYKILGTGLLASTLVGCGTSAQNSETKVTNGIQLAEKDYRSTILLGIGPKGDLQGICTGTFVNDSQVVSAGHCVEGLSTISPNISYLRFTPEGVEWVEAESYVRHPNYNIRLGVSPYDVSVINFPAGSAPEATPIATRSPVAGDPFIIIGYGNNVNEFDKWGELTGSGAGVKRGGTNAVSSVSGGFINFYGLPEADGKSTLGTKVSSGSGDSGGPLFVKGQLAGVTSGGGLVSDGKGGYEAVSKYVDLNSVYVKSFVTKYVKK